MAAPLPLVLADPHFHTWRDAHANPNLGGIADTIPTSTATDYAAEWAAATSPTAASTLAAAVHVETVVGQAEGGAVVDAVGETEWVVSQLATLPRGVTHRRLVAYLHLARPDARALLARHLVIAGRALAGVRMVLNYDADDASITWPQVDRGDYLTGGVPAFRDGCVRGVGLRRPTRHASHVHVSMSTPPSSPTLPQTPRPAQVRAAGGARPGV